MSCPNCQAAFEEGVAFAREESALADPREMAVYEFLRNHGIEDREAQDILAGRAALRSDSPVRREHLERVANDPWMPHPASTVGERDEPEFHDYEQGFDDGWWKGLAEGKGEALEGYEERWVVPEAALKGHMLRGPCPAEGWVKIYVPANVEETWRLPRQVEGDEPDDDFDYSHWDVPDADD